MQTANLNLEWFMTCFSLSYIACLLTLAMRYKLYGLNLHSVMLNKIGTFFGFCWQVFFFFLCGDKKNISHKFTPSLLGTVCQPDSVKTTCVMLFFLYLGFVRFCCAELLVTIQSCFFLSGKGISLTFVCFFYSVFVCCT